MIIMGVDPGLTRCGVGVIEAGVTRRLSFIHVDVVRSDPKLSQDLRLLAIYNGLVEKIERFAPDMVSIERVFAQENRNTVLGTAQAAGLAMLAAVLGLWLLSRKGFGPLKRKLGAAALSLLLAAETVMACVMVTYALVRYLMFLLSGLQLTSRRTVLTSVEEN